MKGHSIPYSAAELAWVEANKALAAGQLHAGFCATFARSDVSAINLCSLRKRNGWETGRTGRFEARHEPHNKGKPFSPPGSEKGRFKKGNLSGHARHLRKEIGAERVNVGYLERKVHGGLPMHSRWRAVHIIRWVELNGPVPEGWCLKCLDGDTLNTDPSNWEAIPRGVAVRLNGGRHKRTLAYDAAHPDIKPTVMAVAKLKHRAKAARPPVSATIAATEGER